MLVRTAAGSKQVRCARGRERKARSASTERGCAGRIQRCDVRCDIHAGDAVLPGGNR
jgi:hypothetical protein